MSEKEVTFFLHQQIGTYVECSCGRGWARKGLMSGIYMFRDAMRKAGWSIADGGGGEMYIGADGIKCPVCNGRMTAEEYKIRGE